MKSLPEMIQRWLLGVPQGQNADRENTALEGQFSLAGERPWSPSDYPIVAQWLAHYEIAGANSHAVRHAALQWALQRGSRSGRVAWQFARDWAGRLKAEGQKRKG